MIHVLAKGVSANARLPSAMMWSMMSVMQQILRHSRSEFRRVRRVKGDQPTFESGVSVNLHMPEIFSQRWLHVPD